MLKNKERPNPTKGRGGGALVGRNGRGGGSMKLKGMKWNKRTKKKRDWPRSSGHAGFASRAAGSSFFFFGFLAHVAAPAVAVGSRRICGSRRRPRPKTTAGSSSPRELDCPRPWKAHFLAVFFSRLPVKQVEYWIHHERRNNTKDNPNPFADASEEVPPISMTSWKQQDGRASHYW